MEWRDSQIFDQKQKKRVSFIATLTIWLFFLNKNLFKRFFFVLMPEGQRYRFHVILPIQMKRWRRRKRKKKKTVRSLSMSKEMCFLLHSCYVFLFILTLSKKFQFSLLPFYFVQSFISFFVVLYCAYLSDW